MIRYMTAICWRRYMRGYICCCGLWSCQWSTKRPAPRPPRGVAFDRTPTAIQIQIQIQNVLRHPCDTEGTPAPPHAARPRPSPTPGAKVCVLGSVVVFMSEGALRLADSSLARYGAFSQGARPPKSGNSARNFRSHFGVAWR